MPVITLKNTPIQIDLSQWATGNGWSISNGIAYHDGCFAGLIKLKNIPVVAGTSYILEYEATAYTSGTVYPIVGGVSGTPHTGLGVVIEQFDVPASPDNLFTKFYSDGTLGIKYMKIYPVLEDSNNGVTIGFNAEDNRFTSYYDWKADCMLKFVNDFFVFENGRLWKHNASAVYNNFHGTQHKSSITFYVNLDPTEIKQLFSMRQKSNKVWSVPTVEVLPYQGKPNGQLSRLKKGRFQNLQGDFFADFLRDMNDPRFDDTLEALMRGAELQGSVFKITIENEDVTEVRLMSVDVTTANKNYTY